MSSDADTVVAGKGQPLAVAPPDPAITVLAGRYLVQSLLGGGGMGRVYLALDTELDDERVAVKMLRRDRVEQPGVLAQLRSEVKLARRVTHANVVRTFDIGVHEGQRFITLEFIEGESLASVLARGPLSVPVFLAAARALCDGLGAAHAVGIVHRDIKPANVLVAPGGRVVLTDFGVACLTASDDACMGSGTPRYMAPEQVEGRPVDARTDIYALGLLFFEMLAGRRPFADPDLQTETARRLVEPAPDLRDLGVPEAIASIVRTAMATVPEQRYAGAPELKHALSLVAVPPVSLVFDGKQPTTSGKSVAVLMPSTVGDTPAGLDEHLADTLRRVGLRVPSASAVAALHGRSPQQIGKALDVDAVLELALRHDVHDGAELEVEAWLRGVVDDVVLFHVKTCVPEGRLMQLALRIVSGVGGGLRARESPSAGEHSAILDDPEVLALYTQARRLYHQRWAEPNDRACALLERALLRRADDPTLLAALALALARRCSFGAEADVDRAIAVAERARTLAPWSPEPHLASALLEAQLANEAEAVRELRLALRLAPWHPESHARIGELAAEAGLVEDAERHLMIAVTLEPALEVQARWARARIRAFEGDVEAADRTMGPPPADAWQQNYYFVGRCRLVSYDATPERIAALRTDLAECVFEVKTNVEAIVAILESREGSDAFVAWVDRKAAPGRMKRRISFFDVVRCEQLAYAGRHAEALASLRRADGEGIADILWLDRCPVLDPLRGDAEFRAIAERVRERAARIVEAYRQA